MYSFWHTDRVVAERNAKGKDFCKRLGTSIFESVRLARLDESTILKIAVQAPDWRWIRMSSSTSPQLFGLERSVYTRIARLALEEKGVPYSLQEVEIFGPDGVPGSHLGRHPFGRIPVLQHGEFVIYETNAISRYIDEAFQGHSLQPSGVEQRARMNQFIGVLDSYAYRPMVWGVFVQRVSVPSSGGAPDESLIATSLESSSTCLRSMEALMGDAPFLAGESISLADLHAYPMLRYFCLAPEGLATLRRHVRLYHWYRTMLARPSVVSTITSYEQGNERT